METKEITKSKFKNSMSIKLIVIAVLALLLLIPTGMIRLLINERQDRRNEVISEVTQGWGEQQIVCGPILTIPYWNGSSKSFLHILPENISVTGDVQTTKKHRGIYDVILYGSQLEIKGSFKHIEDYVENIPEKEIQWNKAFITIGVTDLKGIFVENFTWNTETPEIEYYAKSNAPVYSGITFTPEISDTGAFDFNLKLLLKGSESLSFVPVGKTTDVRLKGDWNCASTIGSFVSDSIEITSDSFDVRWKILESGRNISQSWTGANYLLNEHAFGVSLIMPVDNYQKTTRSNKYAILFVGLTFIVFLFSEILNKKRIHPVQYLLVGLGLVLFYSLLLAFSEHLRFIYAYIIASTAIITLIVSYTQSIFRSIKISLTTLIMLVALYTFLYILLQLADYSLLAGNIGLFIVLALVMYFSRKIDWYGSREVNSPDEKEERIQI